MGYRRYSYIIINPESFQLFTMRNNNVLKSLTLHRSTAILKKEEYKLHLMEFIHSMNLLEDLRRVRVENGVLGAQM